MLGKSDASTNIHDGENSSSSLKRQRSDDVPARNDGSYHTHHRPHVYNPDVAGGSEKAHSNEEKYDLASAGASGSDNVAGAPMNYGPSLGMGAAKQEGGLRRVFLGYRVDTGKNSHKSSPSHQKIIPL